MHIAVAQELPHNPDLPDRDLAVFLIGTPEMDGVPQRPDVGAGVRAAQPGHDARGSTWTSCVGTSRDVDVRRADLLPPQLRGGGAPLRRRRARHPQGGDPRRGRRAGDHPRLDGDRVYIVRGLGNPESFESASHGAGRRMSRNEAKRRFTVDDLVAQTDRRRVPQGRRRDRRDPRGLQGHRAGHGQPGRPGRGRGPAAPGDVVKG